MSQHGQRLGVLVPEQRGGEELDQRLTIAARPVAGDAQVSVRDGVIGDQPGAPCERGEDAS